MGVRGWTQASEGSNSDLTMKNYVKNKKESTYEITINRNKLLVALTTQSFTTVP
jgi:hypothetical protein